MTLIVSIVVYVLLAVLVAKIIGWARKSWYPTFMYRMVGLSGLLVIGSFVAFNVWYAGSHANYGW